MSLSEERPTNPTTRYLKIKSGKVVYWDKTSESDVEVQVPFEFIVLDQLSAIKGWSDADNSNYWSNEVRSIGRDILNVRTSKGVKESGIWKEIKSSPGVAGAKYNASIYIAHKSADGMAISNLSLKGAALNAWIDFTHKNNVKRVKVVFSGWSDGKKGSITYKVPVFEVAEIEEGEREEAINLDRELQAYLKEYLQPSTHQEAEIPEDVDNPIAIDEIPF